MNSLSLCTNEYKGAGLNVTLSLIKKILARMTLPENFKYYCVCKI